MELACPPIVFPNLYWGARFSDTVQYLPSWVGVCEVRHRQGIFIRSPPVLSGEMVATFESFMVFLVFTRLQLHGFTRWCCGMASSESYLLLCLRNSSPSGGGEPVMWKKRKKVCQSIGLVSKFGTPTPMIPMVYLLHLLPFAFEILMFDHFRAPRISRSPHSNHSNLHRGHVGWGGSRQLHVQRFCQYKTKSILRHVHTRTHIYICIYYIYNYIYIDTYLFMYYAYRILHG